MQQPPPHVLPAPSQALLFPAQAPHTQRSGPLGVQAVLPRGEHTALWRAAEGDPSLGWCGLWKLSSSGRAHNSDFRSCGLGSKCGLTLIPGSLHPGKVGPPHRPAGSWFRPSTHTLTLAAPGAGPGRLFPGREERLRDWGRCQAPAAPLEQKQREACPGFGRSVESQAPGTRSTGRSEAWPAEQKCRAWQRPLGGNRGLRAGQH